MEAVKAICICLAVFVFIVLLLREMREIANTVCSEVIVKITSEIIDVLKVFVKEIKNLKIEIAKLKEKDLIKDMNDKSMNRQKNGW